MSGRRGKKGTVSLVRHPHPSSWLCVCDACGDASDPFPTMNNKKAQLSLTNPRDAKACQKLLQFDVLTTLSLTILAYLHSYSCC